MVGGGNPGRGAWLCQDSPGCLEEAVRRRAFERALRGPVGRIDVECLGRAVLDEAYGRRGAAPGGAEL